MFLKKISNLLSHIGYNTVAHSNLQSLLSKVTNIKSYCTFLPKNYYSVLGIKPKATDEEIKEAYYSLSKKFHPDLNVGNKIAESKILEVNEAFEVLGNKSEKEKYDNKMFPKVWEKQSFIYNHEERSKPDNFIFRRTFKAMPYSYDQFLKHRKGEMKRKRRHFVQKLVFHKGQSSQKFSKINFKT